MRVAVSGSLGFTGRYLTKEIQRRGYEFIALSSDLRVPADLKKELGGLSFDALVHLAGNAFTGDGFWRDFIAVNQIGTCNLLEAVAESNPGIKCIIPSSAQVYGEQPSGSITEAAQCCPKNAYAISKYAMEISTTLWADRLDIQITRPFNYTGIGQDPRYLLPKIVSHFAHRVNQIELGNIHVRRDYGDVRSVVAAYCDLLDPGTGVNLDRKPINVASGVAWSVTDILQKLTKISGHEIDVIVNPAFVRSNDIATLCGSNEQLRKACPNWVPHSIDDTLEWMLEHMESQSPSGSKNTTI